MEIANTEQAAAWDGHEGEMWTEHAERYERAGRRHWQHFLDADLIGASDVVLDVGCGTGKPTRDAARLAARGSAVGVDLLDKVQQLLADHETDDGVLLGTSAWLITAERS